VRIADILLRAKNPVYAETRGRSVRDGTQRALIEISIGRDGATATVEVLRYRRLPAVSGSSDQSWRA
jgi:hypothetical protein